MRILLQFPEGLKKEAISYSEKYSKEGHEVFLSCAACYGACDLALEEAKKVEADKIVHFGHAQFVRIHLPVEVEYVEYHVDVDLDKLEGAMEKLGGLKTVAFGTTVQHVHQLKEMLEIFKKAGIEARTGKGIVAYHEGQVLGCDAQAVARYAKDSEATVFVGDGMFHALAISSEKPVYAIHPKSGEVRQINDEIEKLARKRRGAVIAASKGETFGILVSTKIGQCNVMGARRIKEELEKKGKKAEILIANELNAGSLENFQSFDAYVNTACPRIMDDNEMFGKPVINPKDMKLLLELI
ncbi:MAG: diphthamide biosynthesis enzyme Dph2 [Candidatus Micrarchaeota archaeon]